MDPQDKPKRRLVTYVTEEVYEQLVSESKLSKRSVSSIAEMKISQGMSSSTEQHGPAHISEEKLKDSVVDTITNLPEENLQILADRLAQILNRHGPAQSGTYAKDSETFRKIKLDPQKTQDIATRMLSFINDRGLTQRSFKATYGIDITHIAKWKQGTKMMCSETFQRFEKILAS